MHDAQYMRIETIAGGFQCSPRAFVKAAHTKLTKDGKSPHARELRHLWIRNGLARLVRRKIILS
jgi:hypothetical protein